MKGASHMENPVAVIPVLIVVLLALALAPMGCGDEEEAMDSEAATSDSATETDSGRPDLGELAFDHALATSDPFNDPSGPYFHQVLKAVSSDGLGFTKVPGVVLDKASVPDIISMPDGRLIIYAVDGSARSDSGLMVAVSDDNGDTWKQGSLQVDFQGTHGKGVDPDAVLLDDGSLRLYYIVFPRQQPPLDDHGNPVSGAGAGEPIRVMSATSENGIDFIEEDGVRLQAVNLEFMTDPDVVEIGGKWFMYVSQGQTNVAYTSDDGMTFTAVGPVRNDGAVSNTVPVGDDLYRQYFCGQGISSAVTSDGLNFDDDPGVRLMDDSGRIACDPAPVQTNGAWLLFYKTGDALQPGQQPGPGAGPPPGGGSPPPAR